MVKGQEPSGSKKGEASGSQKEKNDNLNKLKVSGELRSSANARVKKSAPANLGAPPAETDSPSNIGKSRYQENQRSLNSASAQGTKL